MSLPVDEFLLLVNKANEKEVEDMLHRQWCTFLPYYSLGYFKRESFKSYRDRATGKDIDTRPTDVIIDEIKKAHGITDGNI